MWGRQLILSRPTLYSFTKSRSVQYYKVSARPPAVASSFDSMAGINGLPKETLHEIVSYLSPHISELLKCSLVCRGWSEVANAALYRDIDLSIVDLDIDERWDEQAGAKTRRRQLRLLRSISKYIYSTQMVYHY